MASGFGMHGGEFTGVLTDTSITEPRLIVMRLGIGRCFPFWQEVMACYVMNTSAEDISGKKKCSPVLEDYYECLHHRKEVSGTGNATQSCHLNMVAACENVGNASRPCSLGGSDAARRCAQRQADQKSGSLRERRGYEEDIELQLVEVAYWATRPTAFQNQLAG